LLIAVLMSVPLAVLIWVGHHLVPSVVKTTAADLPIGWRMLANLVFGEIGYYWGHRLSHEIPFLWRFHSIHHSAGHVDFLVNSRAHPFDMVFGRVCGLVPIALLGLGGPLGDAGSRVTILATLFGFTWGYFIHANVRWRFGPLEWLVSTPAFHHWHHVRSGPINRNYSSNFPWIDFLFGTLHLPDSMPLDYGIKTPMPDALIEQLVHPFLPSPPAQPSKEAHKEGHGQIQVESGNSTVV
jgi:sterol desaturase/sphingolipid hydroxylase (fatty acid hydroxylase superfamily)